MPESLVIANFHREILNPPWVVKSRLGSKSHDSASGASKCSIHLLNLIVLLMHAVGKFIVHRECCARLDGKRQTFSIHSAPLSDQTFVSLPMPFMKDQEATKKKKFFCKTCNTVQKSSTFFTPLVKSNDLDWVIFIVPT